MYGFEILFLLMMTRDFSLDIIRILACMMIVLLSVGVSLKFHM